MKAACVLAFLAVIVMVSEARRHHRRHGHKKFRPSDDFSRTKKRSRLDEVLRPSQFEGHNSDDAPIMDAEYYYNPQLQDDGTYIGMPQLHNANRRLHSRQGKRAPKLVSTGNRLAAIVSKDAHKITTREEFRGMPKMQRYAAIDNQAMRDSDRELLSRMQRYAGGMDVTDGATIEPSLETSADEKNIQKRATRDDHKVVSKGDLDADEEM